MRLRTPTRITTQRRGEGRPQPARPESPARRRARSAGGPDDRAVYGCVCGLVFEEHVSTSVVCPRCGAVQAWQMATADLTVIALGRTEVSASPYIAEIQRRLSAQDRVRFRLHAMGTSLEGSTEDVLRLVGELHAVPFEMGLPRVYTVLKLDERRDRDQSLEDKVASVERLLGES